jgi:iron complex outermembrane receptor protein
MFKTKTILIGCVVFYLAGAQARAQTDLPLDPIAVDQAASPEEALFQDIPSVFGSAKYEQKITEAPSSVTIITAEQINKYGYRQFSQIIDSVPGLFMTNDRNYGYVGFRGFGRPGDYNTRVLLLVDNHRLNDAIYDQAAVGSESPIDVDVIERVEIIRGPASSLYGTNAFFGVINVITKKGRDIKGIELSGETSSYNSNKGRLTIGKKLQNGVEFLLSGNYYGSIGNRSLFYKEFDSPATRRTTRTIPICSARFPMGTFRYKAG